MFFICYIVTSKFGGKSFNVNMIKNVSKSYIRSREKASRVKRKGNNKEHIFTGLIGIGIDLIKGTRC